MPRFVVLRHETPPGFERPSHWDFMLEKGDVLQTWALLSDPSSERSQTAETLDDHRPAYLDREGPISGGRGSVTRWDEGRYEILRETNRELVVRLQGKLLLGEVTLSRGDEEPGSYRFVPREKV